MRDFLAVAACRHFTTASGRDRIVLRHLPHQEDLRNQSPAPLTLFSKACRTPIPQAAPRAESRADAAARQALEPDESTPSTVDRRRKKDWYRRIYRRSDRWRPPAPRAPSG